MVQFVLSPSRFRLLYQRQSHAIRRSGDGARSRRRVLCRCLSVTKQRLSSSCRNPWPTLCGLGILFALTLAMPASLDSAEPNRGAAGEINTLASAARLRSFSISESQARTSVQWLANLAIEKMPRAFHGDKDWGKTRKVWAGVKVHREGLQLKTKRRFRELQHGRWIKYELTLPPKAATETANAVVATVHRVMRDGDLQAAGSSMAPGSDTHWRIESSVETPMMFTARVERWNMGVQWYSISVEGRCRVRLDSTSTLTSYADYAEIPPALVVDPKIQSAKLYLKEFEVDRVSKIGGDVAEEWGELMEKVVRELFLKRENEKLVVRLNHSIDKNRDDLRLSLAEWFSKW